MQADPCSKVVLVEVNVSLYNSFIQHGQQDFPRPNLAALGGLEEWEAVQRQLRMVHIDSPY